MKVVVTSELLGRAQEVFKQKGAIYSNDGLTRTELRLLERKGLVEKSRYFRARKFVDSNSTVVYIWKPLPKLTLEA